MERETESLKEETRKIEGEIQSSYHDGTDHYNSQYDSGYEYGGYGSESSTTTATNGSGSDKTVGDAAVQAAEQTAPASELAASNGEAVPNAASGSATASAAAAVATEAAPAETTPGKDVRA